MTSPMDEMILRSALKNLEFERDAALKRAEAAEAERRDAERRENAAHLEREQSARLRYRAEVALLRWDTQAIGAALGLPIGADVPGRAVGAIKSLRERAEKAEAEVSAIKQAISDPENQPSQFGTVPVTMLKAANRRADSAEAEVARLKGLFEWKRPVESSVRVIDLGSCEQREQVAPPEPYAPRVGDVVCWAIRSGTGEYDSIRWTEAEAHEEVERLMSDEYGHDGQKVVRRRPFSVVPLHAAVGLPAEAPAAPRVLPEHLAWMEADAAWACSSWSTDFDAPENKKRHDEAILAARALVAAVARRDGGGK